MKRNYGPYYTMPLLVWITAFFVIPTSCIFLYSFLAKGIYGGIVWQFSFDAYRALVNSTFVSVVLITLKIALLSSLGTVLLALPTAYFIARSTHKDLYLFLIIIPFWTNFLIRIYAWIAILGNNGFLNSALLSCGLINDYVQLLYNPYAVIIVTIYTYLPYAILPLFATIEKFDFSLLEAARDLGATKRQAFMGVLIPNIKGGITTAILFTLIPALGAYAIPKLVGGRNDSIMLGNIIADELTLSRNWPLASAISVILTVVTLIAVMVFIRSQKRKPLQEVVMKEQYGYQSK